MNADLDPAPELDAGDLASWIVETQSALRGEASANVPCGTCTACCTSSQFVHIGPDETAALERIPPELLFPAPLMPPGHVLLGYDERGHCPMLVDGRCSIYEDRPQTCRTYDCRVFAATGTLPEGADKRAIADQVRRWRFRHLQPSDAVRHAAVSAAADYLIEHPDVLVHAPAPVRTTQRAALAIGIHELFLDGGEDGSPSIVTPEHVAVVAGIRRVAAGR